jgi:hypothetical protein
LVSKILTGKYVFIIAEGNKAGKIIDGDMKQIKNSNRTLRK